MATDVVTIATAGAAAEAPSWEMDSNSSHHCPHPKSSFVASSGMTRIAEESQEYSRRWTSQFRYQIGGDLQALSPRCPWPFRFGENDPCRLTLRQACWNVFEVKSPHQNQVSTTWLFSNILFPISPFPHKRPILAPRPLTLKWTSLDLLRVMARDIL